MQNPQAWMHELLERQRPGIRIIHEAEVGNTTLIYGWLEDSGEVEALVCDLAPDSASIFSLGTAADAQAAHALVLHDAGQRKAADGLAEASVARTWQCLLCAFVYDEAAGLPEMGIAAGTRWEDVPDDWCCPDCGATKDQFEMVQVA